MVTDDEKDQALNAISNSMIPGRVQEVRPSTKKELAATHIIWVDLEETSVKISTNEVDDDPDDLNKGTWAGILPIITSVGEPIPADEEAAGLEVPGSVRNFRTGSLDTH
jgi:hypothetical protein